MNRYSLMNKMLIIISFIIIVILGTIAIMSLNHQIPVDNKNSIPSPENGQNPFENRLAVLDLSSIRTSDINHHLLPLCNMTGSQVEIIEYAKAKNDTYVNVISFLCSIDSGLFLLPPLPGNYPDGCSSPVDYAVRLHDDAEIHGLKCRIIGSNDSMGNWWYWNDQGWTNIALVAFDTIDNGTVYADPSSWNVSDMQSYYITVRNVTTLSDNATLIFTKKTQVHKVKDAGNQVMYLYTNASSAPVSYSKLLNFLYSDDTNKTRYTTTVLPLNNSMQYNMTSEQYKHWINNTSYTHKNYTCMDFSAHMYNDAQSLGIKCGFVELHLINETEGHEINAFQTTDKGIILIDPQGPSVIYTNGYHQFVGCIPIWYIANDNLSYDYFREYPIGLITSKTYFMNYTSFEEYPEGTYGDLLCYEIKW